MHLGPVVLQGPLIGQLRGALWALLLTLLGHGAALHMGQHSTLVGKALLTPATGVGLRGGRRRGGGGRGGRVCCSIYDFVILFALLLTVFFLSLFLLLFFSFSAVLFF